MVQIGEAVDAGTSITRRDALIAFGRLAVFTTACGVALEANAIASALFGVGNKLIDITIGHIPWLGGKVKGSIHAIETRLTSFLGEAAAGSARQMGTALHDIGDITKEVGDAMLASTMLAFSLYDYLIRTVGIAAIGPRLQTVERKQADQWKAFVDSQGAITHGRIVLPRVTADVINARINARLQPLEDDLAQLRREMNTVEGGLALGGSIALPDYNAGLRERVKEAERGVENLWKRVKGLDKVTVGTLAGALVASALLKLGLGWLKCSKVGRFGKGICRMPGHWFDSLLGLLADFVAITNICQVLPWLEEGVSLVATPLIDKLTVVGAGLCHGKMGKSEALAVPQTYRPPNPGIGTLQLP